MKFEIKSLLKDKNVLYVTLFIAICNMFAYLMFRQFDAILFFIVIGLIANHFSKNMIIILLIAILSTNLAISIKLIGKVKEGLEMKKKEKKEGFETKDKKEKREKPKNATEILMGGKKKKEKEPKFQEIKKKASKDGFTQQLNPARINGADEDDEEEISSHPTVDYASTLESAYDNLDKLLSSDAINSMSEDTQRLAEKQQMLMGNINKLQPMMEKAGSMLEGLDMGKMNGVLEGLTSKLGGAMGKK